MNPKGLPKNHNPRATFGKAAVNPARLAPNNSYDIPAYIKRGYYIDKEFTCRDCGQPQVWTARQQKWWYEVMQAGPFTEAVRCRPCRQKERRHREVSRRTHATGPAVKTKPL